MQYAAQAQIVNLTSFKNTPLLCPLSFYASSFTPRLLSTRLLPTRLLPPRNLSTRNLSTRLLPPRHLPHGLLPTRHLPPGLLPTRHLPRGLLPPRHLPLRSYPLVIYPLVICPLGSYPLVICPVGSYPLSFVGVQNFEPQQRRGEKRRGGNQKSQIVMAVQTTCSFPMQHSSAQDRQAIACIVQRIRCYPPLQTFPTHHKEICEKGCHLKPFQKNILDFCFAFHTLLAFYTTKIGINPI
jgi:hypothetical protein